MNLGDRHEPLGLSDLTPAQVAFFLDFDWVLVDIAPGPDAVRVSDPLVILLAVQDSETSGACAVVSGRPVTDLRRHLPLVPRAVIGSHGAETGLPGAPALSHPLIGSDAVAALPAFAGRVPVHFGDDTTDEPALAMVAERGGVAVKGGRGPSAALHRVSGPDEVDATLSGWLEQGRMDE